MTERVVCATEDLPPGSRVVVSVDRIEIGVFNIGGELVAIRNRCPHAGAPMCDGLLTGTVVSDGPQQRRWAHDGEILRCPWHGWEFKLPEGRSLVDPPYLLSTYEVRVLDGQVLVDTASGRGTRTRAEART
ncbi:Rieske (2Fe-2S) protein [Pseudonocardia sp. KRD291]|uniref:Rieske (2Fe-2S) protein n=1 Tax=Pseudonocardia sp. KRD291 TaxID=2792007 RepID=UPI001C4A1651|nr:Rieske (2Fe-2S) protein [Pseudonocardia sp. KRD291]MBW0102414.1 Rieske (2Fe-2S) protein [Pseudonocardia sp. KRD291]